MQTLPFYTSKQLAPALLLNFIFIPSSLQSVAAVEVPLEVTLEVLVEVPPPILTVDWERIKIFKKKLQ